MTNRVFPPASAHDWRKKARLNNAIAQDLSESFGGRKADYLKMLNRRLKTEIDHCRRAVTGYLLKAA
jgi:hypothetical protein